MPEDFSPVIADILNRLEKLEKEVELLRGNAAPEESVPETPFKMDFPDISELSGLEIPDTTAEDASSADVVPEDTKVTATEEVSPIEDIPETVMTEEKPAAEEPELDIPEVEIPVAEDIEEETFGNLFGAEIPAREPVKKTRRGAARETINDEATASRTVLDAMTDKSAWRHDIPGPEVKELRSAIGLGDKVFFCHSLFRDDNALYQDTVARINSMKKLDEAVEYLAGTFPEWDWNSDTVYRFMMAVRRKVRK